MIVTTASLAQAASTTSKPVPAATFESTFSSDGEPAMLYYKVQFAAGGGTHVMQIWRDHDKRLRRRTDDKVDTYVIREDADPAEYKMVVVDYGKRITTRIDRNNLVRLGNFSDWFDLAHGLRHPVGAYQIAAVDAPSKIDPPISACRWYDIHQGSVSSRVCWSDHERLPLVIWSASRGVVWRVTEINRHSFPADTFAIHDVGFVRNDANADIAND
ncbi:hypothetical protein [Caballeronia sp. DA-9]|uniref:hypothetical protein n=1 Tax=Caballeronia sp. DA-9 TaxID=3436237 RepID=UPI003F66B68A